PEAGALHRAEQLGRGPRGDEEPSEDHAVRLDPLADFEEALGVDVEFVVVRHEPLEPELARNPNLLLKPIDRVVAYLEAPREGRLAERAAVLAPALRERGGDGPTGEFVAVRPDVDQVPGRVPEVVEVRHERAGVSAMHRSDRRVLGHAENGELALARRDRVPRVAYNTLRVGGRVDPAEDLGALVAPLLDPLTDGEGERVLRSGARVANHPRVPVEQLQHRGLPVGDPSQVHYADLVTSALE